MFWSRRASISVASCARAAFWRLRDSKADSRLRITRRWRLISLSSAYVIERASLSISTLASNSAERHDSNVLAASFCVIDSTVSTCSGSSDSSSSSSEGERGSFMLLLLPYTGGGRYPVLPIAEA